MPMRALVTGGGMGASTEGGIVASTKGGIVASAVAAGAIVIPSHATSLDMCIAFIRLFMGGYSSTCPRYGSPPHPTLV
jgi:hypothetical protein